MSFNDDEPIVVQKVSSSGVAFDDGDITATLTSKETAPLEANEFNLLVELEGSIKSNDRRPLDLVLVLDISGSMYGEKIERLKTATEFVIKKLGPMDRVSVVTFNHSAHRLCPLRQITDKSKEEILKLVHDISARGTTNISDGLKTGLKVLNDRKLTRMDAMMLMSDGVQNDGADASLISLRKSSVHTFGFGEDHDPTVLTAIAKNSVGGTFNNVYGVEQLSYAFAQCLAGLLIVAVQKLKVTVSTEGLTSKIKKVYAGNYKQTKVGDSATRISFGDLYNEEHRKVVVTLTLPAVTVEESGIVLNVTYRIGDSTEDAGSLSVTITRTNKSVELEKEGVGIEMRRNKFARKVKASRVLADGNNMEDARKKLLEARNVLEKSENPNNPIIGMLKEEHDHLFELMASNKMYKEKGKSFALSLESSHERQRFAFRGDMDKHRMFAIPRMDMLVEQVKSFHEDPTKAPPTEMEDWEKERDAMLARISRRLL